MARKKLTDEEKRVAEKARDEQQTIDNLERDLAEKVKLLSVINEPTRQFEVGEEVDNGNLSKIIITEKLYDGKIYKYHYNNYNPDSQVKHAEGDHYAFWMGLRKKNVSQDTNFTVKDELWFNYLQQDIWSLLHRVYYWGIDFDPEYQRGLVWNQEDKEKLIDSIFNNVEIGKFALIKTNFMKPGFDLSSNKFYQMLDGKQRLSAIREFYEDRITYKGLYFSQLSLRDQNHFQHYKVVVAEVDEPEDKKLIYKYFLKLNTTGKPISEEQINKVKELIKE